MVQNEDWKKNHVVQTELEFALFTFNNTGTDNCILTLIHLIDEVFMRLMRVVFDLY